MEDGTSGGPIWARWAVGDDGGVEVVATYGEGGSYVQRLFSFVSLDEAAMAFGPGFREVVAKVLEAGSRAGRWRP
jgi:hypothetical protein